MKSVLISVRPKWCELIANGKKTVEIRKTKPKLEPPFKVYIYCTGGPPYLNSHNGYCYLEERDVLGYRGAGLYCRLNNGVIGEFVCGNIDYLHVSHLVLEQDAEIVLRGTCLTKKEVEKYIGYEQGKNIWEKPYEFFGWHISDLKIYDHPKKLSEIAKPDKCPYNNQGECTYACHCYRAGQTNRCGDYVERPPQSWCYVEEGGE